MVPLRPLRSISVFAIGWDVGDHSLGESKLLDIAWRLPQVDDGVTFDHPSWSEVILMPFTTTRQFNRRKMWKART
jgi:hypothetical protein